jgi:hypothetical protein
MCPVKGSDTHMADPGKKGEVYRARFRFRGREYKQSLQTKDESAARGALHLVEVTLHPLHTGQLRVPDRVDPRDFVVSGGTLTEPGEPVSAAERHPNTAEREQITLVQFSRWAVRQQQLPASPAAG